MTFTTNLLGCCCCYVIIMFILKTHENYKYKELSSKLICSNLTWSPVVPKRHEIHIFLETLTLQICNYVHMCRGMLPLK